MKSHQSPLEQLLENEKTFMIHEGKLFLFSGISEANDNDRSKATLPYIKINDVRIPSESPLDYCEVEKDFVTNSEYGEKLQKDFVQNTFAKHFYSTSDLDNLRNIQKISQYVLAEALPALLVAYADDIGIKLPDENSFLAAQDLIFAKLDKTETDGVEEEKVTLEDLKDVFYKEVGTLLMNNRLVNLPYNQSVLSFYTNNKSYFGFAGHLYELDEKIKEGVKVNIEGKEFGLSVIQEPDYIASYPGRNPCQLECFDDKKLRNDYAEVLETYILARTTEDQEEFIEDMLPRLRLGEKYKYFKEDDRIEFGSGDVTVGAYWLENDYNFDLGKSAMILYIGTPVTFIRGVKVRKGEYDHLSKDLDLDENELLYWKFPENKVCAFISSSSNGDLLIDTSSIVEPVNHTGIAGSISCYTTQEHGNRYQIMCGVEGGFKHKPLGQDAVDIVGNALNYYLNGISPETVLDHSGGTRFSKSYNTCFPIGEGYPEIIVDSLINEYAEKGRTIWKANDAHILIPELDERRSS